MSDEQIPRRNRIDQYTPAETAIYDAVQAVERAGASVHLTKAINLLAAAQSAVADFVDGVPDNANENEEGYDFIHAAQPHVTVTAKFAPSADNPNQCRCGAWRSDHAYSEDGRQDGACPELGL